MESAGGTCVFTSEWDRYSAKTYAAWFGEKPCGDIREVAAESIPDHDVLCAGFPCQPFSIAGVSKKKSLGREHGFRDATQGTLFFQVARIVEVKRPPVLLLENVKNLRSHNRGHTWQVIISTLRELDYELFSEVIDAADYVPQHRERVFIVAFDQRTFGRSGIPFSFPEKPRGATPKLAEILEAQVDRRYTLSDHLWNYLQNYAKKHAAAGNGFGYGLADLNGVSRTLSARYFKDGSEILIPQKGANPRRLTPREAARLMGFPEDMEIVVSDTQAYKQFGNSVVPAVVADVGRKIAKVLAWQFARNGVCLLKKSGH
jgi:DNA (cytosine-5)-methyltransferase 1